MVVSALSKVTDLLYRISDSATVGDRQSVEELLGELRGRHISLVNELLAEMDPLWVVEDVTGWILL